MFNYRTLYYYFSLYQDKIVRLDVTVQAPESNRDAARSERMSYGM